MFFFFLTSIDFEDTMLELIEANTFMPSDLSSFCQMVGIQTKSLNASSDAQRGEKAHFTPTTNDKKPEKEQSDTHQSLS